MNIIENNLSFGNMTKRSKTERIILHHAAAETCSAEDIHRWHRNNGWAGIGYHFLVRKDGSVYRGRPENMIGAHASGANYNSIGICFEGNYQHEQSMPAAQLNAGAELVANLKAKYGISKVIAHRDVCSTSCPGQYFPFNAIASGIPATAPSQPAQIDARKAFVRQVQSCIGVIVDGIVGPKTRAALPVLSTVRNRRHRVVRVLQSRLRALGYNLGRWGVDGVYGGDTKNAIKAYQRDHGLSDDGVVGRATWNSLLVG